MSSWTIPEQASPIGDIRYYGDRGIDDIRYYGDRGASKTNWCVDCWPDKVHAEMIYRGSSLCPKCFEEQKKREGCFEL